MESVATIPWIYWPSSPGFTGHHRMDWVAIFRGIRNTQQEDKFSDKEKEKKKFSHRNYFDKRGELKRKYIRDQYGKLSRADFAKGMKAYEQADEVTRQLMDNYVIHEFRLFDTSATTDMEMLEKGLKAEAGLNHPLFQHFCSMSREEVEGELELSSVYQEKQSQTETELAAEGEETVDAYELWKNSN